MWASVLDRLLRQAIQQGAITVTLADGSTRRYGNTAEPGVHVHLHDAALPRKLVLKPDLAVGEAYMDQSLTIEGDDLAGLLALLMANASNPGADRWRFPLQRVQRVFHVLGQLAPAARAKANVAHHYDLSGALYDLFLDADKQYSCAYFCKPDDTLEQAQAQKKAHIAGKLRIEPGMRVLDIGCGWGGMGLTLARDFGARVVGVTLSEEQHRVATARAVAAGLAGQVDFRLMDYRAVDGPFDRIVSVGMFEHVGVPHYREYFQKVESLLTEDGVALIHTIGRAEPPGITSPWISKYIFPGGYVPALSEMMQAVEQTQMWPCDVEVWRLHYAETLLHWRKRFEARIDEARKLYDDRFCRMWRYYLIAAEMTFRQDRQCVFQLQLARKRDAVPLTRDYLYARQ